MVAPPHMGDRVMTRRRTKTVRGGGREGGAMKRGDSWTERLDEGVKLPAWLGLRLPLPLAQCPFSSRNGLLRKSLSSPGACWQNWAAAALKRERKKEEPRQSNSCVYGLGHRMKHLEVGGLGVGGGHTIG